MWFFVLYMFQEHALSYMSPYISLIFRRGTVSFNFSQVALEMQKRALTEQRHDTSDGASSEARNTLIIKLQQEVKALKENKKRLEEALHVKTVSEAEKATEIGNIHKEYEIKFKNIMKEHKQQLQKVETESEFSAKNTSEQLPNLNSDDFGDDTGLPEKYVLPTLENGFQNALRERPSPLQLDSEDIFVEQYQKKRTTKQKMSPSSSSKGSRESINSSDLEVSQVCVAFSQYCYQSLKGISGFRKNVPMSKLSCI